MSFVHLHLHTRYSPLDGAIKIKSLMKRLKELKMDACAITDHGTMAGVVNFYEACKKNDIKPILGMEAYVAPGSRFNRKKRKAHHLVLLAKNNEGYKNLMRLSTLAYTEGFYYKPRIDKEILSKYSKGLIGLSACLGGSINNKILSKGVDAATDRAVNLASLFEPGCFYLELQDNEYSEQQTCNDGLIEISKRTGLPLVVTGDCHYLKKTDSEAHEVLMAMNFKQPLEKFRQEKGHSRMLYVRSYKEVCKAFDYVPDAIDNTVKIAEQCNIDLDLGKVYMPKFDIKSNKNELRKLSEVGLKNRISKLSYKIDAKKYQEQLNYELDVIISKGYTDYFLICWDFVKYARSTGIPVGPGRGSGAGCIVAWALEITDLDPIKHQLVFERFLNPERDSLPDFDIDFDPNRRDEIIQYIKDKYGQNNVAKISTFSSLSGKSVVKDVGKTLGIPFFKMNEITSGLPNLIKGKPLKVHHILKEKPELEKQRKNDPLLDKVFTIAEKLQGLNRQSGTHACGILISEKPLWEYLPVCIDKNDKQLATQFDKGDSEKCGLVKFDFLGLKNLSVISDASKMIEKVVPDFDIKNIQEEDSKVFRLISHGDTNGVFQLESDGMKKLLSRLRPDSFEDLSAAIALFRPGPLCLSEDTPVLCGITSGKNRRYYQYKKIKEVYEIYSRMKDFPNKKKTIISLNEDTGKLFVNRVQSVVKSGTKYVYRIKVKTSLEQWRFCGSKKFNEIESTLDHRFLTTNGWKKLDQLIIGDYIAVLKRGFIGSARRLRKKGNIAGTKNFKNIAFRHYKHKCIMCDWNGGSLDVNHIDGNRFTDNTPENLNFFCPNHHREYSEGKITKDQVLKERKKNELPQCDDIYFVRYEGKEFIGKKETFDISVIGPHHNFVAADYVVHNSSGMTESFVRRKNGKEEIIYPHPKCESILNNTYGVIVYQEQVMDIAVKLCGFTMGCADGFRKAMGKKIPEVMAELRIKFVEGAFNTSNMPKNEANQLFDSIEKFAGYAFNKAHTAAYAMIGYQTAYLKTYYPAEFMAALMSNDSDDQDKIIKYLGNAKDLGIKVIPPSINHSEFNFTVHDGKILFGLGAIKGIGETTIGDIVKSRQSKRFETIFDLCSRVDSRKLNKNVLELLIRSGALSSFKQSRNQMLAVIEQAISQGKKEQKSKQVGQGSLFDYAGITLNEKYPNTPRESNNQILDDEFEILGVYLSGHPLDDYKKYIDGISNIQINNLTPKRGAVLACIIKSYEEIPYKKKTGFLARVVLGDLRGTCQAIVFDGTIQTYRDVLISGKPVVVQGTVRTDSHDAKEKFYISHIDYLDCFVFRGLEYFDLTIDHGTSPKKILELKRILRQNKGDVQVRVIINHGNTSDTILLSRDYVVTPSMALEREVKEVLNGRC